MSYQYSQEARDRISAFGQIAITEFIEEIPHGIRKIFYDRQPPIQGFRRGSPPEFKEKQKRLVAHLIHTQPGQKGAADWNTFACLWEAWARNRLGSTFPPSDISSATPDAGPVFLTGLAELFPDAARESLERLLDFSGFADSPEAQVALGRFRPASTLARDLMIDALPGRLHKIEGYFEIAEAAAEEVAERIDQLESETDILAKGIREVVLSVDKSQGDVKELRVALERVAERASGLEEAVDTLGVARQEITKVIAAADARAEQFHHSLEALTEQGRSWDKTQAEVSALKQSIDALCAQEVEWNHAVTAVGHLAERIDILEAAVAKGGNGMATKPQVRLFEVESPGPIVEIHSVKGACELIACNLQSCGVMKGAAIATARQILAALSAGQMVQFSGSISDLVADAVAAAIGGQTFHEWRVPVGLVSDEAAIDCLEVVSETSGCLLMKGANRSAFEVYGTAIRDVVTRRQFSQPIYQRLSLIAAWTQGPATFPDGGTLAEIGPVFDTDNFSMRGVSAKLPELKFGQLVRNAWNQIDGLDDDSPRALVSELKELIEESSFVPGNLWTRMADRAYSRLRTIPGGSSEEDLHSVLTLWALPWAKATAGPVEDIARIAGRMLAELQAEAET
ncbi:hypothetical protein [Pseudomonas sp. WS 5413]|uniref:hypothetical protein n=1 Tax=Pseudomonas sp. WS 5413 TaxID=2717488 RepID=UPI0014757F39|nr:hypothetical protein [Pseudomonas sp. WS 5413]NMX30916.1 hypothetical protein [Pseudomonas sp. WS 5413]NMX33415.1 hypothetical protein [Pseudomonas sp. WS 5413]